MAEYAERLTIEGDVDAQVRGTQLRAKVLARSGRFEEAVALSEEAARLAAGTDYLELHAHALMSQTEVLRLAGRASSRRRRRSGRRSSCSGGRATSSRRPGRSALLEELGS